jgi:hypothetical protein
LRLQTGQHISTIAAGATPWRASRRNLSIPLAVVAEGKAGMKTPRRQRCHNLAEMAICLPVPGFTIPPKSAPFKEQLRILTD